MDKYKIITLSHNIEKILLYFCQKLVKTMLIGRKEESSILLNATNSDESQFIAVYGRRRVGKTYLIKQTFNETFAFQHTGLARGTMREQLAEFQESLKR